LLSQQPLGPKDILIAQFQIDNQDLQFKWEDCDKIARSVELNLLQNCLLKVRLGNQEPIFIPLRKPVLRMPFLFKSLTAPNDFQISYPEHKGKENKGNLEVCHLPEKPTIELRDVSIRKLTESENIEIDRLSDSSYEISVGNDLPIHFTVLLDPEYLRVTLKYDKVQNWNTFCNTSKTKPQVEDINKEIKNRNDKLNNLESNTEKKNDDNDDDKIAALRTEITKLKNLKTIVEKLYDNAELHYAISMEIGGRHITILETDHTESKE